MVKKVLPPLKEENQVPNIAMSGEWKSEDATFLEKLAKGLKLGGEEVVSASEIVSVPDVWARVLIVRNGLLDNRKSIVDEWRGTLALLALAPYYKHIYELSASIVNLDDIKTNPFTNINTSPDSGRDHIGKILFDVLPPDTMAQGQDWKTIGVLNFHKQPIAIVNPYTMVAAARNYEAITNISKLPWYDYEDGFLKDPCNAKDMRNEQYAILSHYIENLITSIQPLGSSNGEIFNAIMGRLQEYKKDAEAKHQGVTFGNWQRARINLNLPSHPVYDRLAEIFEGVSDEEAKFDCGLETRAEFSDYIKGAIFCDHKVAQATGKPLSDIRIWKNYSLNTLRQDPGLSTTIKNECQSAGYLYLTPEDIFTEKLVIFAADNRQLKEHTKDEDQYAYPVNSAMLMFMDAKALSTNCTVSADGNNYKATFYLELKNDTGTAFNYALEKIYKAKDVVKNRTVPLSFSVWPNIAIESWDQYYFFYDGNSQVNVLPKNVFAVKDIRNKLENLAEPSERVRFIDSMSKSHQVIGDEIPIQQTTAITELRALKSSPEAILCNIATQQSGKTFVDHAKRTDVGLIIFPDPEIVQETTNQWSIGIDFGTTNTCTYVKENKDAPKELNFKNRINLPYETGSEEEEKEEVMQAHKEFVPSRLITVPFMTILRERIYKETTENLPYRSNFIYYVDQVLYAIEDLPDDRRPLKFNLKWDAAEQSREKVQYFLSQLVLQAGVEAAANGIKRENLTFNFSFPQAYDFDQLRSFRRIAKRSVNVGLGDDNFNTQERVRFDTESLSSALYFAKGQNTAFTENVVTIDIGGGTSDLSIWQDTKLIWRNSFRLAGKDVLIDYLCNNLTLIKEISGKDELLLSSYADIQRIRTNRTKLNNGVELLVNSPQFGSAFSKRFDIVSGTAKGKELKNLSELALSGILYYVSQVLNHLIEQGQFKEDHSKSLKICLGGKASTLYKIVFEDQDAQEGLSEMIKKVTQVKKNNKTEDIFSSVSIEFTQIPKHEVSYGLLVSKEGATDLNTQAKSHETVLGEAVMDGKSKINILSKLNPNNQWRVKDLTQLKRFIKYLQAYSKIHVKMVEKFESDLEGRINAELKNAQSKALDLQKSQQSVEGDASMAELQKTTSILTPIFIFGLKQIVHEITSGKIKLK